MYIHLTYTIYLTEIGAGEPKTINSKQLGREERSANKYIDYRTIKDRKGTRSPEKNMLPLLWKLGPGKYGFVVALATVNP